MDPIKAVDLQIKEVNKQVEALSKEIEEVIKKIEHAEAASNANEIQRWDREKAQLREEKIKLLRKEEQLRDEKARLQSAGVPSKPNFGSKRSRCDQTAEFGIIAKELVKKRKAEAGEAGVGVFEAGWSILPRAEPLGTKDLRFLVVKAEEKLGVAVMGRSHFKALVDRAVALMDGKLPGGGRKVLVHGPAGFGKTHLLLQLIIYLTAALEEKKQRVAPILDCSFFKADRVEAMKQALAWAYSGEKEIIEMIASLDTMQDVKGFLDGREEELLFCLDQYQELELEPEAKKELDARLYQFRTIVVTSAGGEELTRENDTLHQQASMFPVHDGLTQEERKLYDLIYGTECSTPAVQRLVREKLEGVAGCLADWFEAYYGRPAGDYSVHSVFGASPTFQVGRLEPVKQGEPESKHAGIEAAEVLRDGRTLMAGPAGSEARRSEPPGSVGKGEARGGTSGSGEGDEGRAAGVNAFWQAAGPEAHEEAGVSAADAEGGGAIRPEESRRKEGAEDEQTRKKAKRDWEAWERFLECKRVVQITRSLARIYDKVKAEGGEKVEKWIAQMIKMVCSDSFVGFDLTNWDEVDLRNVAVEGGKVRPAFPLVREAIAHFVEQVQGRAVFYSDLGVWATLRSELKRERVPAVAGLLAERCAIGAIVDGGGYKAVLRHSRAEQVKLVFFERYAEASAVLTELTEFQKSGMETRIAFFVPRTPFYPAMDMAILVFKKRDQQLGLVEQLTKVQITLQSAEEHGHSPETAMHISNVKPWLGDAELESVKVAFCYIVPGNLVKGGVSPHIKQEPAQLGRTRAQAAAVRIVEHTHIELAFSDLDRRLGLVDNWKRGGR